MSLGPMSVAQALITSSWRHGGIPPPGEGEYFERKIDDHLFYSVNISELIWLLMTSLRSHEPLWTSSGRSYHNDSRNNFLYYIKLQRYIY